MQLLIVWTVLRKYSLQSNMVWIIFHPKTYESEKRFMHESFLSFLRAGVAVTSLNMDGFNVFVKIPWQVFFAVFSACKLGIQLKLSCVIFSVSFFIMLPINQHSVDKNQYLTLPLRKGNLNEKNLNFSWKIQRGSKATLKSACGWVVWHLLMLHWSHTDF